MIVRKKSIAMKKTKFDRLNKKHMDEQKARKSCLLRLEVKKPFISKADLEKTLNYLKPSNNNFHYIHFQ